jgi:hypothetical protein
MTEEHGNGGGNNSGPGGGNSGNGGSGNGGNPGHGGGGGNPGHGGDAHIFVDNVRKTVREGPWVVSALKAAVGVDAAKVLAEISGTGIKDLDDAATIVIRDGMRFMSHARTGASS